MFDNETQQILRDVTYDNIYKALKVFGDAYQMAKSTNQDVRITDANAVTLLKSIFMNVSETVSPGKIEKFQPSPYSLGYLLITKPNLYQTLVEKGLFKPDVVATALHTIIMNLRDIADDVIHSQANADKTVPYEYMQFIGMFLNHDRTMLTVIDKKTKVEDFIYLVLKDIRKKQPELYKQYQEICRAKTDDTPLMQAVKQTISYKYYAGSTKSFCPMFLKDICRSPQYQAMGRNPKYQLILLDMINLCNYLSGSRRGSSIEANGFHYTWSDCNVEASEDTFQKGLHEIVARGWFKVVGRTLLDDGRTVKMYVPSTDWKKKSLSEADLLRIQQHKEGKLKRLKDSRQRFRGKGLKNECATDVPDDLGHT